MNRLVIIGNGFDLAHGLPTSYGHFIDDYWTNAVSLLKENNNYVDNFIELKINSVKDLWLNHHLEKINDYKSLMNLITSNKNVITLNYKNSFLAKISNIRNVQNWVDVENLYYEELIELMKPEKYPEFNGLGVKVNQKSITHLNYEFEKIKDLLENYLIKNINEKYRIINEEVNDFINIFDKNTIKGLRINEFYKEIPKNDSDFYTKMFNNERLSLSVANRKGYLPEIKFENYFLSFNYTFTAKNYIQILGINPQNLIEIHGVLFDEKNPINFGFGDEMDKNYQNIEEKNDNEYLKNIKSFQYLHTSNYKRLLDLIDSGKFQVYIMGHSCGLSDRTLLNTIFEHENCRSIKIFYHQKEDGTDNYTEITQNISRHFNKKKLMREKIVNKTLCQPLPQIKLPKIE